MTNKSEKPLELYIHIPFCVKKCAYCDFLSFPLDTQNCGQEKGQRSQYVTALKREIEMRAPKFKDYMVKTIFIGGGTPSVLQGSEIMGILQMLKTAFSIESTAEITIEANPDSVRFSDLQLWKEAGVNRLSLGLQSANDADLKRLGRLHTFQQFLEAFSKAKEAGFHNINVDLISAIPKQTLVSYEETLSKVVACRPTHISAYSLIIEEGTPFFEIYNTPEKKADLVEEEIDRLMYQRTKEILKAAGYHRYEISNYALKGYPCRHNLGYWERVEYLGLGLGASSFIAERRFKNTEDMDAYLKGDFRVFAYQQSSKQERMEEYIFLGLRKTKGISFLDFQETFGSTIDQNFGATIQDLMEKKLLVKKGDSLFLSEHGLDISNYVFGRFIT